MRRIILDPRSIDLTAGVVTFTGDDRRYLDVLRLHVDDPLLVLDGLGNLFTCTLTRFEKKIAEARITQQEQVSESLLPVTLLQGVPKGSKIDLVLQKGTELGITRFEPVMCDRSLAEFDSRKSAERTERWQKIVQEAARQSERPVVPPVLPPAPLRQALQLPREGLKLILLERSSRPLADYLQEAPDEVTLLVGPEGGFTDQEAEAAKEAGFLPVSLGNRILRTETAALAVASIVQYRFGDLGSA